MQRAAVIIGVNKTGNLPTLQAAVASAHAVEEWAQAQAFGTVTTLTDEAGPVTIQQIKSAIKAIVNKGTVEQLVVYFSGHGVNIRYGEYWLLSDAPNDTQAAVNVEGSVVLARQAGIPHVVFLSDACRTAAEGIQAQFVTGSEIFPNSPAGGPEKPVDLYFATTLGAPALEIKDPGTAANRFKALYTDALVDGLYGRVARCLENVQEAGTSVGLVRPWPLRDYLEVEVPRRLTAAAISVSIFQTPDARITSPPRTWLARITRPGAAVSPPAPISVAPPPPPPAVPPEAAFLHRRVAAVGNTTGAPSAQLAVDMVSDEARERAAPFGRAHFESRCGFKVRGAQFVEGFHPSKLVVLDGPDSVRVDIQQPASVVLRFDSGKGVIFPAIPEFVTGLTVNNGELVDVVYEPSDTSWRWGEYQSRLTQLRELRGRVAAAARFGVFRLEGDDALQVARQMQLAKGLDPTMALYAAYAYDSLQRSDRIREMQNYLRDDLELRLFDIALLAGTLDGQRAGTVERVFPAVPMLSQGWALLAAHRISLPPTLESLPRFLQPSLWTLFAPQAVDLLKSALQTQEIH